MTENERLYEKPACWAIGSLTIFIMLSVDVLFSRLASSPLYGCSTAPLAIAIGLMIWAAAACASKGLRAWAQDNAEFLLPMTAAFLVAPLILASMFDLLFKLSATSWCLAWTFALIFAFGAVLLVLCGEHEIKLADVSAAALACYGASVLLRLIFGSTITIALLLSLVAAGCLVTLWGKYVPLDELLFDYENDEFEDFDLATDFGFDEKGGPADDAVISDAVNAPTLTCELDKEKTS